MSSEDYLEVTRVLTFEAGQASQRVAVSLLEDDVVEDMETFNAVLTSPTNGAVLGEDLAVVTIADATGMCIVYYGCCITEDFLPHQIGLLEPNVKLTKILDL